MNVISAFPLKQGMAIAVRDRVTQDAGWAQYGSLGCIVRRRGRPDRFLLSAYHVLFARANQAGHPVFSLGQNGHQNDHRDSFRKVARLHIGRAGIYRYCGVESFIDAGLARLVPGPAAESCLPVCRAAQAQAGDRVSKFGAATGFTEGVVADVSYPDHWYWEYRSENAPRQIRIAPSGKGAFAEIGDSGAAVFNRRDEIVGILWGSNASGDGVASHIIPVIDALGLDLQIAAADLRVKWEN